MSPSDAGILPSTTSTTFRPSIYPSFPTSYPSINPTLQPTWDPLVQITSTQLIVRANETSNANVQQVASQQHEDDITWIHACLIISAIFIFFTGWVGIFCFIYSQKRKRRREGEIAKKTQPKNSINHLTVIGQKMDGKTQQREGSQSGYKSQSALDHAIEIGMGMDNEDSIHNARFLNIVKTSDIFEGNKYYNNMNNGYSMDIGSKISKLSRKTTACDEYCVSGVAVSDVDLSETLDSDSDTDMYSESQTSEDTNCHLVVMPNGDMRKDSVASIDI